MDNNSLNNLANWLQIFSFMLNVSQTSTDQLMKELAKQDRTLDEQTSIYLNKIIKQNEEIINLLKKGDKHGN